MSEAKQANKVKLENVRVAFPVLFEPKATGTENVKYKYSAAFLFPKDHPAVKVLQAAVAAVATAKWGVKAQDVLNALKAGDRMPVHDGDAKDQYAGYAGNYFLNASNEVRPLVIDGQRAPLTAGDGTIYSGCYVNGLIEVWAQDNQYGRRINASLMGVQFVKDGERLAGGSVASPDDFEPLAGAGQASNPGGIFDDGIPF